MPRTFQLTLAYDGTAYAGWQVQPGQDTIQSKLESALRLVTGESIAAIGSGRTDAGVHAIAQVATCTISRWRAPAEALRAALNRYLPPDIVVVLVRDAPDSLHAIRDAIGKRYRYQLQVGGVRDAFDYRYRWHIHVPLHLDSMRKAAAMLVGVHDFASFQAAGSERKTTVRHVRELLIMDESNATHPGMLVAVEIEADGFLYNMVRNIVGTLVEVGRGKRDPAWVVDVLTSRNRTLAGPTAPPHGLFLKRVDYAEFA